MSRRLPAEWEVQDAVQLTLPHADTDWIECLDEAKKCFNALARAISERERLLLVTPDVQEAKTWLTDYVPERTQFVELPSNDTWARDHAPITVLQDGKPLLLDFTFNGWGLKFASDKDNALNLGLKAAGVFGAHPMLTTGMVLEGGSVESDGKGTLLTTEQCMLSYHRNPTMSKADIEARLQELFGVQRVLWLSEGHLEGDDTDAHVDTLARLCPDDTIAYVQCTDPQDDHFEPLRRMEQQLQALRTAQGRPYKLVPLPMCPLRTHPEDGHRLPGTYANFLIVNGAVLLPTYQAPEEDALAVSQLQLAFPEHEIVPIDCSVLIRQHGSLHCVTMQYPAGTLA